MAGIPLSCGSYKYIRQAAKRYLPGVLTDAEKEAAFAASDSIRIRYIYSFSF
jgi:hypothetical protein